MIVVQEPACLYTPRMQWEKKSYRFATYASLVFFGSVLLGHFFSGLFVIALVPVWAVLAAIALIAYRKGD
jgi:hypothetical protein